MLDTNGNGELEEDEWNTFFELADTEVQLLDMELTAEEMEKAQNLLSEDGQLLDGVTDLKVEMKEEEEDKKDIKEEPIAEFSRPTEMEIKQEVTMEKVNLTREDLSRLFAYLLEEGSRGISKESFLRIARLYMKVVQDTAMTSEKCVTASGTLKRLEPNEVIEVIDGPLRDPAIGIQRVFGKALSDGTQGWVSVTGNQGSNYLVEGGNLYKVVKETILTDSFELNGEKASIKLKETTRKLKEGTVLEAHEWPRKDEKSGLTRLKGKVRNDGAIGWVTTTGNTGVIFLELV